MTDTMTLINSNDQSKFDRTLIEHFLAQFSLDTESGEHSNMPALPWFQCEKGKQIQELQHGISEENSTRRQSNRKKQTKSSKIKIV